MVENNCTVKAGQEKVYGKMGSALFSASVLSSSVEIHSKARGEHDGKGVFVRKTRDARLSGESDRAVILL